VKTVLELAAPTLVAGSMVVVGRQSQADDFRRVAHRPRLVLAATPGLVLITPLVGQLLSLALAPLTAVTVLGRVEFAVFATAYFVCQMPLALAAAATFRLLRGAEIGVAAGGGHG
jgi:predicted Na+-dependent transporter